MSVFLGFDTSNYTTSVAAVGDGMILSERKILDVKQGQRGLRQSDAVFLHMKNMPSLYNKIIKQLDTSEIGGIGVSTKPRNAEGSYMPVFLAGMGYASVAASTLGLPLYEFSHQDGHIMAGIESGGYHHLLEKPFVSVHLSGGTTEILKSRYNGYSFENEIVGGTKDISVGQLIDRVGVAEGLCFPCGKEMERLSVSASECIKLKICTDGGYANFSGAETALLRVEASKETKALSVLKYVAEVLAEMLGYIADSENTRDILVVGGVASNQMIRKYLSENVDARIYYADAEYSTDNAVGVAALAGKGGR